MQILSTLPLLFVLSVLLSACAGAVPVTSGNAGGSMQNMDQATATPIDQGSKQATDQTTAMPMDHGSMQMNESTPFDAQFIDSMIEHHQGAIDMAREALQQTEREEITTMAAAIIAAQNTEIEQMQSWRTAWYPDLPSTGGIGMGMGDMNLSSDDSLPFDQRFLTAMVSHHQGAIEMARMAQQMAEHQEINDLSDAIISAQQAEIEQMQGWLEVWFQ